MVEASCKYRTRGRTGRWSHQAIIVESKFFLPVASGWSTAASCHIAGRKAREPHMTRAEMVHRHYDADTSTIGSPVASLIGRQPLLLAAGQNPRHGTACTPPGRFSGGTFLVRNESNRQRRQQRDRRAQSNLMRAMEITKGFKSLLRKTPDGPSCRLRR